MVFCDSGHLQNKRERPDIKRKHTNTDKAKWKEPELTTLISEVGGGKNKQSKQAHVLEQWFSKWADHAPWGRFWGARGRKKQSER